MDAVIVLPNPFFTVHAGRVAGLALKHHLPLITGNPGVVEAGGLMDYGASVLDMWRQATTNVDGILKGARLAALPVEQPTKFALVINLKTTTAFGRTSPPSLLPRADQ